MISSLLCSFFLAPVPTDIQPGGLRYVKLAFVKLDSIDVTLAMTALKIVEHKELKQVARFV